MVTITLYHYTHYVNVSQILQEGLKLGDNRNGTAFDLAILGVDQVICLTSVVRQDRENYGNYPLRIEIDENLVEKIADDLYICREKIDPECISDPVQEFFDGTCTPSIFCVDCEQYAKCHFFTEK